MTVRVCRRFQRTDNRCPTPVGLLCRAVLRFHFLISVDANVAVKTLIFHIHPCFGTYPFSSQMPKLFAIIFYTTRIFFPTAFSESLMGHLHLTATMFFFLFQGYKSCSGLRGMVQSMVVVDTTFKWCQGWSMGIKELGLKSSCGHLCHDFVFIQRLVVISTFHL